MKKMVPRVTAWRKVAIQVSKVLTKETERGKRSGGEEGEDGSWGEEGRKRLSFSSEKVALFFSLETKISFETVWGTLWNQERQSKKKGAKVWWDQKPHLCNKESSERRDRIQALIFIFLDARWENASS